jgi:hypothetical protein
MEIMSFDVGLAMVASGGVYSSCHYKSGFLTYSFLSIDVVERVVSLFCLCPTLSENEHAIKSLIYYSEIFVNVKPSD